jgi:cardiolipin synthase
VVAYGLASARRLGGEWRLRRDRSLPAPVANGIKAVLLLRDNIRNRHTIENVYLGTLARARSDVLIANAYFFPGRRLRKALIDAAQRGVRVRLLLQGRSEYPMQYRACRHTYDTLIDQGIEIHEYMASYLHAKVAVIDDYAMVGSANMDPFSLLLAREANVYVHDQAFSAELRRSIEEELQRDSVPVTADRLRKRSWAMRLIDWFAWRMLRAGVAITGKASEY